MMYLPLDAMYVIGTMPRIPAAPVSMIGVAFPIASQQFGNPVDVVLQPECPELNHWRSVERFARFGTSLTGNRHVYTFESVPVQCPIAVP